MSEEEKETNEGYLDKTKEWFKTQFRRDLKENNWKNIPFNEVIKDESTFGYHIRVALQKEKKKSIKEYKFVKYVDQLYDVLVPQEIQANQEGNVVQVDPTESHFSNEYKGCFPEKLMNKINCCYKQWLTSWLRWHSPYLSLFQSSGYGKSRACQEIATSIIGKDWLTIYICCRDSESTEHPPQTKPAMDFFKSLLDMHPFVARRIMEHWMKWFIFFRFAFHFVFLHGSTDMEIIVSNVTEMQIDSLLSKWGIKTLPGLQFDSKKEVKEHQAFWSLCFESRHNHLMLKMFSFIASKARSRNDPEKFHDILTSTKILWVMDEARFLSVTRYSNASEYTLFRTFHAAMHFANEGFFAVVVDTQLQPINYAPPRKPDPSLRFDENDDNVYLNLYHPFSAVTTTDVMCDPTSNVSEPKHRFTLGRPLWTARFDKCGSEEQLIDFALTKLFGGLSLLPNNHGMIACIVVLTGISIVPASPMASILVASHMATCLAVDPDRESLLIVYPIEPVLAEAAKGYVIDEYNKKRLFKIFEPVFDCFRKGDIHRNGDGTLVAKMLILLGQYQVSVRGSIISLCQRVLVALFGASIMEEQSMGDFDDEFSFNCFANIMRKETHWKESDANSELALFFNRGAAIQLPKQQDGVTFLLPIRRKQNTEKGGSVQYSYKYLLVHVENRKIDMSSSDVDDCAKELDETFYKSASWENCNIGWSIIMNVGQKKQEAYWYPQKSTCDDKSPVAKRRHESKYLVVNGIGSVSYPGLLSDQSLLEGTFHRLLQNPLFDIDDWLVDHGDTYTKKEQELDFRNLCSLSLEQKTLKPSHSTTEQKQNTPLMDNDLD